MAARAFSAAAEPHSLNKSSSVTSDWTSLQFVRIREDFNAEFVASFPERGIDGVVYSLPSAKDGVHCPLRRLDV